MFKAIYMFHMPLFMVISGYLSYRSIQKTTCYRAFFYKRFKQLILPVLSWSVCLQTCLSVVTLNAGGGEFSFYLLVRSILHFFLNNFWFLWAIFFSYTLLLLFFKQVPKHAGKCLLLSCFLLIFCPIDMGHLYLIRYIFPFFCLGYTLAECHIISIRRVYAFFPVALFAAICCYLYWDTQCYVYNSKMNVNDYSSAGLMVFRYSSNLLSMAVAVGIAYFLFGRFAGNYWGALGRASLGIYILQTFSYRTISAMGLKERLPLGEGVGGAPGLFFIYLYIVPHPLVYQSPVIKRGGDWTFILWACESL